MTIGKEPYPELSNSKVLPAIMEGTRLPKPEACPANMFETAV
jgi:hypothetical protein